MSRQNQTITRSHANTYYYFQSVIHSHASSIEFWSKRIETLSIREPGAWCSVLVPHRINAGQLQRNEGIKIMKKKGTNEQQKKKENKNGNDWMWTHSLTKLRSLGNAIKQCGGFRIVCLLKFRRFFTSFLYDHNLFKRKEEIREENVG